MPGILAERAENPCGARYRMLDGRHRICTLKRLAAHVTASRYFVLTANETLQLARSNCRSGDDAEGSMPLWRRLAQVASGKLPYTSDMRMLQQFLEESRPRPL